MYANWVSDGLEAVVLALVRAWSFHIRRWVSTCIAHFFMVSSEVNLMMKFSIPGSPFQKIWQVYEPA
jgi:hypothetical protein